MSESELDVLVDQLDELMVEGAVDPEDALEIAIVAGAVARLGGTPSTLAEAEVWRDGTGRPLLDEAFAELDVDAIGEVLDGLLTGEAEDEEVEDVVFDVDDLVTAAIWAGRPAAVREVSRAAESTVRLAAELFDTVAPFARDLLGLPWVGQHLDLYGFWLAVVEGEDAGEA